MGVLDDPASFYCEPQVDWSLGDVVLVPSAVLWDASERTAIPVATDIPSPSPDGSESVTLPLWKGVLDLPTPVAEFWISPAIIVADDCVLDKDFNELVDRLVAEGYPEDAAVEIARADSSLDPLVPVAPVLPYASLRSASEQSVRTAQATGFFPVVESDDVDPGYADFTRIAPVSRRLLRGPVASLSESARRILRWKLAQYFAFRNLSVDSEIRASVGKTITDVRTVADSKSRLVVDVELNHGEGGIRLRQEPRRETTPPGHTRGR